MLFVNASSANYHLSPILVGVIIALAGWEMVWKGLALWRAGRNNQPGWFIALLILNTAGLLPIAYLWFVGRHKVE